MPEKSALVLDEPQKARVCARTEDFIHLAERHFRRKFAPIPIRFNLKARAAGMYCVRRDEREIRYNPFLFARYFEDNLRVTVPHEVAHYICDMVYGLKNIRPHGNEWKNLMGYFRADPSRTCDYDLNGIPLRKVQRYLYSCACSTHQLSSVRHNRIQRDNTRYYCRKCHQEVVRLESK